MKSTISVARASARACSSRDGLINQSRSQSLGFQRSGIARMSGALHRDDARGVRVVRRMGAGVHVGLEVRPNLTYRSTGI
ncbi:hypothetical protein XthCFBP4691_01140 [Xanthomonas theicola]|uniref:Uncharacterized protein n=1 Tax=Xanthomonas theicola TaxID=56464 RepID=A0A2S6ZM15_9XANT|nr:hypothetical protein XthCFBP4691_01140 [Xanthomonas theicola]